MNKNTYPLTNFMDKSNIARSVMKNIIIEREEKTNITNRKWIRDREDQYYRERKVVSIESSASTPDEQSRMDGNDLSQKVILKNKVSSQGEDIIIGILDTGIDTQHPSLNSAFLGEVNCLSDQEKLPVKNDHGTKVAGLIAGNDNKIKGLAINAKIRSYRTNDENGDTDDDAILKALDSIIDNNTKTDILNLSLDIAYVYISDVQSRVNALLKKGIIVVVSGYTEQYSNASNIANVQGTFPVGIIKETDFKNVKANGFNDKYLLAYLNADLISMGLYNSGNSHPIFKSSSAYTALTTGLIARFLSSKKIPAENRISEVRNYLLETSFNIRQENDFLPYKPYKNEKA